MRWYRKTAEQGHKDAQFNLGLMYGQGQGVAQDYIESYAWFNIAASQGTEEASGNRDIVADLLTPDALTKAQELSKEYYKKYVEPFQ